MPTVLIVDDEASILQLLKVSLRKEFTILTAQSGEEGLLLLREHPVDLIISDQRMPGMTGLEFFQHVVKDFPDMPRILLTGFAEPEALTSVKGRAGLYKFMAKPWDHETLREAIHAMIAGART
jgi:DNA-binding NtrC family response regulator